MMRLGTGTSLFTLLGLGTADLALLNLWAIPALLSGAELQEPANAASPAVEAAPARDLPAPGASSAPLIAIRKDPEANAAEPAPAERAPAEAASASATGALASGAPARVEPVEQAAALDAPNVPAALPMVHFGRGSWWLGAHARDALADIARHSDPSSVIEIEGHADQAGPRELNQRISEERARAVADALTSLGIDPKRIRIRAFGEERPSATGRDRRVEIALRGER